MHITCLRKDLYTLLQQMASVVDISKVQTKYSAILISAQNTSIMVYGTNQTAHLQLCLNGSVLQGGECCIQLVHLLRVISSLTSETIDLTLTNAQLIVNSDNGTCISLDILKCEYFDKGIARLIADDDILHSFNVDCNTLAKAITTCLPFCDLSDQSILSGIHFEDDCCGIRVMGCSHIAFASQLIPNILEEDMHINFTLTNKSASCITAIFNDTICVAVGPTFIQVQYDNNILYLSVMEGQYPPMMSIVPKTTTYDLPIDRCRFKETFDLTDIVSTNTLVSIEYRQQQCLISYANLVSTVIPLDIEVATVQFRLDYSLLRKIFKVDMQEQYTMQYNTATTPAIIQTDNTIFMFSLAVASAR